MKIKMFIGIAIAVLILAQLIFGGRGKPAPTVPSADGQPGEVVPAVPARPEPADIVGIRLGEGDDAITLTRQGDGWVVEDLEDMPADNDKIDRLLTDLLRVHAEPLLVGAARSAQTGLEDGGGYPVSVRTLEGRDYAIAIGLRPWGEYNRTYARLPDGSEVTLSSDVRGDLGLWKNRLDAPADPMNWMNRVVMRFNPEDATAIHATYPDHAIRMVRDENYSWHTEGYVPIEQWNRDGLTAWLADLAAFQIASLVLPEDAPAVEGAPSHTLEVQLGDRAKRLRVYPNHAGGEGMLVESDDYPGRLFHLPEWRFRKYFRRLPSLFPGAVPMYDVADIRFQDIRRGGETVKITRRDGEWQAVALAYPLLTGPVDRLARLLSGWHPEDYATPDFKTIRPNYGGPMVEVILANGDVHQYRLAGRHPLFPWRYVILDGKGVFSVTESEAGVMFPDIADILDLGRVFGNLAMDAVAEVDLAGEDRSAPLLVLRRDGEDWTAEAGGHTAALEGGRGWRMVNDLLQWQVAGFYDIDSPPAKHAPAHHLRVVDADGRARGIAVLPPEERDVPYIEDGGRAFLVDRNDFSNWLAEARRLIDEMENQARAEAARREEAERQAARERERERLAAEVGAREAAMREEWDQPEAEEPTVPDDGEAEPTAEFEDLFAVPDGLSAESETQEADVTADVETPDETSVEAAENLTENAEALAEAEAEVEAEMEALPPADPDPEAEPEAEAETILEEPVPVDDPLEIVAETIEALEADRAADEGMAPAIVPEDAAASESEAGAVSQETAEALPETAEVETVEDGETAAEAPAADEQPDETAEEAAPAA